MVLIVRCEARLMWPCRPHSFRLRLQSQMSFGCGRSGTNVSLFTNSAKTKKTKTAATKLAVGDKLPSLTLKDDKDADVDVSTLSNVVFFIYPKVA